MTDIINEQWATARTDAGTSLKVIEAQIRADDTWSPRWQANVTVTTPADRDELDPRTGARLQVDVFQRFGALAVTADLTEMFGGGTTGAVTAAWGGLLTSAISNLPGRAWNSVFIEGSGLHSNLWIRDVRHSSAGTSQVFLESAECLLQDARWLTEPHVYMVGAARSIRALLSMWTFYYIEAGGDLDLTVTPYEHPKDANPLTLQDAEPIDGYVIPQVLDATFNALVPQWLPSAGQTLWDWISQYLTVNDLRLWGDEFGNLWLGDTTDPNHIGLLFFGQQLDRPAVRISEDINRNSSAWGDGVIVEYEPRDPPDANPYIFIYPDTGSTITKPLYFKYDEVTPATQFAEFDVSFVETLYDRAIKRGRSVPFEALNNFNIRPGYALAVDFQPFADDSRGITQAITWRTPATTMSLDARDMDVNLEPEGV